MTPEAVGRAATAGAAAVLVDGPIPAGALGADAPGNVPVLGVPQDVADEIRADLAARQAGRAVGRCGVHRANPASRDGGAVLVRRAGVRRHTQAGPRGSGRRPRHVRSRDRPGRCARFAAVSGSSVAAAVVAGAGALLAEARPDLDAAALKAALVQTAPRPAGGDRAAPGLVDVAAAPATEVVVDPAVSRVRCPARDRQSGEPRHHRAQRLAAPARRSRSTRPARARARVSR